MATLGNILGGIGQGLQTSANLGLRLQEVRQQQRQQQQAQFSQGLATLANLHRVPKPFRSRVVQEINERSFGGAFDEDTIKRFAQLNEQDSQMLGELMQQALPGFTPQQFRAVARQMGGVTDAFQFLAKFADRRAAQQAQQQERDDLAALGGIGKAPSPAQPPPTPAPSGPPSLGTATAQLPPQQTETLTLPTPTTPTTPPVQPNVQQQIERLQEQLIFLSQDPRGRRLAAARPELAQNIRAALSSMSQQQQRGTAQTKQQRDAAQAMRKEFTQNSKTFREIAAAFGRVQAAIQDPSPAGDIALVFAFMKMLDPTSVVREGEQATARNAGGIPDRIRNTYNRLLTGELFGGERSRIRQDFANRAGLLFQRAQEDQAVMRQQFEDIARRQGLDPRDVLLRFRRQQTQPPGQRRRGSAPPTRRQAPSLLPETQQRINDRFNK